MEGPAVPSRGARSEPASDPTPARLTGIDRRWWILITVGVGTFMSALDGSAVGSILPVIQRALHTNVAVVEWTVTVYLLVVSAVLLTFGRLGDLRGHRGLYLSGFLLFTASSATCGFARSAASLIISRGVQALGAAMLFANAPAILTKSFPAQERGKALGIQATMTYLGLTVGPSVGGWLADALSWRAVFYLNIPVGMVAIFLALRHVPRDSPETERPGFDLAGAAAFALGLVLLLLALNQGHRWKWISPPTLLSLAASVLILCGFLLYERRHPSPMLKLDLFRNRTFAVSTGSACLNYIALFTSTFLMPFLLIQGRGFSPGHAGTLLTAQPLVMALVAPLSGALSDRAGTRTLCVAGMAILAGGLFGLSRLDPHAAVAHIALWLGVVGLGTGLFIAPNNSALMGSAPREHQGIAAGILATARNVGMVIGIGIAGAIFTTVLAQAGTVAQAVHAGLLAGGCAAALGGGVSLIR